MSLLSFTKRIAGRNKKQEKKPAARAAAKKTTKQPAPAAPAQAPTQQPTSGVPRIALQPLITEKAVLQQGAANTVAFRTHPKSTKHQIMQAVAVRYGVTPVSVRTAHMAPKRRTRGAATGRTNAWKKAYVTLPAGKTIDFSV